MLCLCVCPSVCVSVCLSVCVSVCLSPLPLSLAHLPLSLSVCQSVSLSVSVLPPPPPPTALFFTPFLASVSIFNSSLITIPLFPSLTPAPPPLSLPLSPSLPPPPPPSLLLPSPPLFLLHRRAMPKGAHTKKGCAHYRPTEDRDRRLGAAGSGLRSTRNSKAR